MKTVFNVCVVLATILVSSEAHAQFSQQNRVRSLSSPFRSASATILNRPTVSPYLALTDIGGNGNIDIGRNYFTQVRPRLQSQESQRRQQMQIQNIQRNVTQMRSAAARRSQTGARATGHPTRFNYYLQYYPQLNRR